jgi:hypothetical protein
VSEQSKVKFRRSDPRVCSACAEGKHGKCRYVQEWNELNAGAFDAEDFINISAWAVCQCAGNNSQMHFAQAEHDEHMARQDALSERRVVEPPPDAPPGKLELSVSWEVTLHLYPSDLVREEYFDKVMDAITIEAFEGRLAKIYGDVGVVGNFNREITLSVNPDDEALEELFTVEDFHKHVMMVVKILGIEGWADSKRIITSNRPFEPSVDDDDEPYMNTEEGQ